MHLCKTITRFIILAVFMVGFRAVCFAQYLPGVHSDYTAQIPEPELANVELLRSIAIIGILFSSIAIALMYRRHRREKIFSGAIAEKNALLEKLLEEKEWLLKEVHHRVKNNLQIVISLLNAQSVYQEDNTILAALRESQNRMQAISLIHQRLCNNNVTTIEMPAYVSDMINYLRDCFDATGRSIRFKQSIAPLKMGLSQAVPVGLILNEAITNAIKYAFEDDGGAVIVDLQLTDDGTVRLTIADNGKGMPDDFDLKQTDSLGIEIMKALSKQVGGSFEISSKAGVVICVEFKLERVVSGVIKENVLMAPNLTRAHFLEI